MLIYQERPIQGLPHWEKRPIGRHTSIALKPMLYAAEMVFFASRLSNIRKGCRAMAGVRAVWASSVDPDAEKASCR